MAVYQSLTLTQLRQDVEKNCSVVRILWKSQQTGGSYNMVESTGRYTIYVNGQEQIRDVPYVLPKQTDQVIVDIEETVFHNSKGEAQLQVDTWMNTHISAGVVELSETLQLTTIPRASELRASDGVIGGISRLAVTRKNSDYSHSIAWSFGSLKGYLNENGQLCDEEAIFTRESLDFALPDSFYRELTNAKSAPCTLTICTYCDGVMVGQPKTAQFTVSVDEMACRPIVGGDVRDINEKTLALTGDERFLVRNASTALCILQAYPQKGAQIAERYIEGKPVEETLTISQVAGERFRFSATDTRGLTTTHIYLPDMIDYIPLSCEAQAKREGPVTGDAILTISGDYYQSAFPKMENTLTVTYTIDGIEEVPVAVTVTEDHRFTGEVRLTGMDYTQVYIITVRARDLLNQVEKRVTLKKGVPVFDWGEKDFAFHVPVNMDQPLSIENGGTGGKNQEQAWDNLGLRLPLEPDREYMTSQMWNGKPVYTQVITFGEMPNQAVGNIAHHARPSQMLGCRGWTSDGRTLPYGGSHTQKIDVYCNRADVCIDAQSDESLYTAWVQIYYIK